MELRKRDKPTAALVLQREALISRATKRQRSGPLTPLETTLKIQASRASMGGNDGEDNDANEPESDVDPDYQDAAGARSRKHVRERRRRTDRGLTFLQTAREHNVPVRSGKWNDAEELYLRKLVQLFNAGLLEVTDSRLSMRVWLSKMLSCCPMRISKKQSHGEKFKGKSKYKCNRERVMGMSQKDFVELWREVGMLRANFLHQWAREEFGRWCGTGHAVHFEDWYRNIIDHLPTPELARGPNHVKPTETIEMPPWETIKRDVDTEVARKQGRASQTSHEDADSDWEQASNDEDDGGSSCPPSSPGSALNERIPCQESCCTISEADMALLASQELSEPSYLCHLEHAVDVWSTDQEHWELCEASPAKPRHATPSSDAQSTIVLDFGPPSVWNAEGSKEATSPGSSAWVDELLSDETLLACDPALLLLTDVSAELPTEAWFQQLSVQLQL